MTLGVVAAASVSAAPASASPAPNPPSTAEVESTTLLTGDRVLVGHLADGRPDVQVLPADPASGASRFTVSGHTYVVPSAARPWLGTVLDPSLFDVDLLTAAPHGALPVSVVTSGTSASVPGLNVTNRTGNSATGTLTLTSSVTAAWRQALHAAASGVKPSPLFGGLLSLKAQVAPQTVTPAFEQVALNVRVLGTDGRDLPFGEVALVNTDDSRRLSRYVVAQNGPARVSVPVGHYSAVSQIDQYAGNYVTSTRLVTVADFTVTHDNQTLTVDARTATVSPSVKTPRPATAQGEDFEIDRLSATVGSPVLTWDAHVAPTTTLLVSPTPAARIGRLYVVTSFRSTAEPATGNPYSYDLSFVDETRVPASLAKQVQQYQLGDVRSTYVTDAARDVSKSRTPIYEFEGSVGGQDIGFHVPAVRDEYVLAPDGTRWSDTYNASPTADNVFAGTTFDGLRVYPAGAVTPITWLRGPLAPGVPETTGNDGTYTCPECRTTTTMTVELAHLTDTTPGHTGFVQSEDTTAIHTHFELDSNGQQLSAGDNQFRATVTVPSAMATYRMHLDVDRSDQGTTTSTHTTTDLTFRSSATSGGPTPQGWSCSLGDSCQVVPMLTSTMPLPTDLTSRMPAGANRFPLTVSSFAGAPSLTINGAALEASVDGQSWRLATMTRTGNGTYIVSLTNPAAWAGKPVTLRLTATTADGSSLTQTTTAAYFVASS